MVEVPLLWFAAVLGCVRPSVISTAQLIKGHYVHAAGAEHGEKQVVWDHELIVRREAPLKSHTFRIHVEDLVRLVGPPGKGANKYCINSRTPCFKTHKARTPRWFPVWSPNGRKEEPARRAILVTGERLHVRRMSMDHIPLNVGRPHASLLTVLHCCFFSRR